LKGGKRKGRPVEKNWLKDKRQSRGSRVKISGQVKRGTARKESGKGLARGGSPRLRKTL